MSTLVDTLSLYSGMNEKEIEDDVGEKSQVLEWMAKKGYEEVDQVGQIVSNYYLNPEVVMDAVRKGKGWDFRSQSGI
jgi:hypothetical protein